MNYLYHIVPDNLKGKTLCPLNILRTKHLGLYKKETKKYKKRKHVMKIKIPVLNCTWNDVLHFTPVHPLKIRAALRKAAGPKIKLKEIKWFKINTKLLDKKKTIVWLDKEKKFVEFDKNKLSKYEKVPKETIVYYKSCFESKEKPLLFNLIPHILYKGSVSVKNIEIIKT